MTTHRYSFLLTNRLFLKTSQQAKMYMNCNLYLMSLFANAIVRDWLRCSFVSVMIKCSGKLTYNVTLSPHYSGECSGWIHVPVSEQIAISLNTKNFLISINNGPRGFQCNSGQVSEIKNFIINSSKLIDYVCKEYECVYNLNIIEFCKVCHSHSAFTDHCGKKANECDMVEYVPEKCCATGLVKFNVFFNINKVQAKLYRIKSI
ncbi:hypothetical protein GJ496_005066 [Pomphorhynchus laevis]|nr:hypothetical protein GJ496_005066 [Pomphorhynchus laevis]